MVDDNQQTLLQLIQNFLQAQKPVEAIRCYFHIYKKPQYVQDISQARMHVILTDLHTFGSRVRRILSMSDIEFSQDAHNQKLLGYTISETEQGPEAIIYTPSLLNKSFDDSLSSPQDDMFPVLRRTSRWEVVTTVEYVGRVGRKLLGENFLRVIYSHHNACHHAKTFRALCDNYMVGKCPNGDGCWWLHVESSGMRDYFNDRFRVYLHQILVINDMDIVLSSEEKIRVRTWVVFLN